MNNHLMHFLASVGAVLLSALRLTPPTAVQAERAQGWETLRRELFETCGTFGMRSLSHYALEIGPAGACVKVTCVIEQDQKGHYQLAPNAVVTFPKTERRGEVLLHVPLLPGDPVHGEAVTFIRDVLVRGQRVDVKMLAETLG